MYQSPGAESWITGPAGEENRASWAAEVESPATPGAMRSAPVSICPSGITTEG